MMERIIQLPPHNLQETITVNNSRRTILTVAKPCADIMNNISLNQKLVQDHKEELQRHRGNYDDLLSKVNVTQVGMNIRQLGHPRTVCSSPECIDTVNIENTSANQTIYKTHCHPHCYLENVEKDLCPNPDIQNCTAMGGTLSCQVCNCSWNRHLHIDYEQIQVSSEVEDPLVRAAIDQNLGEQQVLEAALKAADARLKQLELEHQTIISTGAKFGAFLKANAMKAYNDAIKEYLAYSIKEEERLLAAGKTNRVKLEAYKRNLQIYEQEKAILDRAIASGAHDKITSAEVISLIEKLKDLPINGQLFRDQFQAAIIGENMNFNGTQNRVNLQSSQPSQQSSASSSIFDRFSNMGIF